MKNKNSKAQLQLIFGMLLFTLTLFAELYVMINLPKLVVPIVGFALVGLICLYVVIDGYLTLKEQREGQQEEQFDNIFKSEKASYLLLKRCFEEIEEKLDILEQSSKIPTEEIINAQKGIAKVIISRTHEDAEALIGSNDILSEKLGEYYDRLEELAKKSEENRNAIAASQEAVAAMISSSKEAVIEGQKVVSDSSDKSQKVREQELVVHLKDMELRLNAAIMQLHKVMAQTAVVAAPVQTSQAPVQMVSDAPLYTESPAEALHMETEPMPGMEPMAEMPEEPMLGMESIPELVVEPVAEMKPMAGSLEEPMPGIDSISEMIPEPAAEAEQMEMIAEPAAEAEQMEMIPEPVAEAEQMEMIAEPVAEAEQMEMIPEPVVEEKPPMPDLSDPNKPMSADDIEALLANMTGENALEAEPAAEQMEMIAEPVVEEKPPMPDMSDPNKPMSADDIEALLANMTGENALEAEPAAEQMEMIPEPVAEAEQMEMIAEPVVEEKPPMPDMSDPNKQMSPDDIAALLANMEGAAEPAAEQMEMIPEPVVEEKPVEKKPKPAKKSSVIESMAELIRETVSEDKPSEPDPNEQMSPDDIAALFASMGDDVTPAAEPVVEAEPLKGTPPMPDMSDPNKQMSPDDIAALFANIGA